MRTNSIMLSGKLKIIQVKKNSKARYAQGIEVGDIITIKMPLVKTTGSRGLYALYADLYKNDDSEPYASYISQNDVMNMFNIFDIEDLSN